ncbi:WecB/TagA/CpsF family glycosyltransferase [Candidatus Viridilinea mediisalina]|uniref:Glycosyl transferase n=1 Tax=Candidatus Viridilinea mediisalina TaxID=2024553 RepID=A0A2A6RMJ0_9CHLR|nr:WecB/TagA/CpsF family glycosyltransferase [Candidatus Viridilinea mediisalina]PDW04136.1 glycosyl transferase [Candidatus Viridilinea mediisalina]
MRKLLVVLGVPIDNLTMDEALARCDEFISDGRATGRTYQIATVNADFVVNSLHDPELQRILQEADMSTADGMPLVWGSRLLGGALPGRVTGADMVPALARRAAEKGYSIFFLGARPGVAAKAAALLQQRNPGLKVAGVYSPPPASLFEMDRTALDLITQAQPDILLVAFGNPKQEKWIRMHAPELPVPLAIGIGGTLDMIVGVTRRAPPWMQQVGLEWLYRMAQEPRRLFKRYLHDFAYFGYFFLQQWWAMRRGTAISMVPLEAPSEPVAQPVAPVVPEPEPEPLPPPVTPTNAPAPDAPPEATASAPSLTVLQPQGRLDVTNSRQFADTMRLALTTNPYLAISLKAVTFLDSTALGTLVALSNQARSADGALYLIEVPPQINRLISLVRLNNFFEILDDAASAEARLREGNQPTKPLATSAGWVVAKAPRLFDAETAPNFVEHCSNRIDHATHMIIDLQETIFLASAGMAALLKLDRMLREHGGLLRITGCSPEVLRTFKLVRLDTVLTIVETMDQAMQPPSKSTKDGRSLILPAQQ